MDQQSEGQGATAGVKPSLLGLQQFLVHPDSQSDLCVGSFVTTAPKLEHC